MEFESILAAVKPFIESYLPQWWATVALVIGTFRMVFKPLMEAAKAIIEATPTPNDNEFIKKVENSKVYYWVFFVLDFLFSLKPKAKLKKEK